MVAMLESYIHFLVFECVIASVITDPYTIYIRQITGASYDWQLVWFLGGIKRQINPK